MVTCCCPRQSNVHQLIGSFVVVVTLWYLSSWEQWATLRVNQPEAPDSLQLFATPMQCVYPQQVQRCCSSDIVVCLCEWCLVPLVKLLAWSTRQSLVACHDPCGVTCTYLVRRHGFVQSTLCTCGQKRLCLVYFPRCQLYLKVSQYRHWSVPYVQVPLYNRS